MLYSSTTNTNNNHINHINNNNNNNKLKKKQAPNAHTISSSSSSAPSFSQREKKDAEKKKNKGTASTSFTNTAAAAARRTVSRNDDDKVLNLSTVTLEELECFIVGLGFPKYRASQVYHWIRTKGVTQVTHMTNLPVSLQEALLQYSKPSALTLITEQISKVDGTIKRAYACQSDGAVIESVLMGPYKDGRYTACISSQAGCAQGCVFCATGQMGFTRQLTSDEIFEQVSQFASHLLLQRKDDNTEETAVSKNHGQLHGKSKRLSNVVFMGMGTYLYLLGRRWSLTLPEHASYLLPFPAEIMRIGEVGDIK